MTDYINRERARFEAERYFKNMDEIKEDLDMLFCMLPAENVAPVRHGRWIEYTKVIIPEPYNKWEQAWKCSECGFYDGFVGYNYCPNCGAKMELEVK